MECLLQTQENIRKENFERVFTEENLKKYFIGSVEWSLHRLKIEEISIVN